MSGRRALRSAGAGVASLLLHACVVAAMAPGSMRRASSQAALQHEDRWGGDTFDVEAAFDDGRAASPSLPSLPGSETAPAEPSLAPIALAAPEASAPPVAAKPTETHRPPRTEAPDGDVSRARTASTASAQSETSAASADPATSAAPTSAHSASNSADGSASQATGARFGASGLPAGVRDFSTAFTRAIPPAAAGQSVWKTHALGTVGKFRLRISLDENGRLESSTVMEERDQPAQAEFLALSRRIVGLLGGGQFALRTRPGGASAQILEITVRLGERGPRPEAEPTETVELGFEPPTPARHGTAFFTLGSGRHFEAEVRLMPPL